jgi:hypothetical protein
MLRSFFSTLRGKYETYRLVQEVTDSEWEPKPSLLAVGDVIHTLDVRDAPTTSGPHGDFLPGQQRVYNKNIQSRGILHRVVDCKALDSLPGTGGGRVHPNKPKG